VVSHRLLINLTHISTKSQLMTPHKTIISLSFALALPAFAGHPTGISSPDKNITLKTYEENGPKEKAPPMTKHGSLSGVSKANTATTTTSSLSTSPNQKHLKEATK